MNVAQLLTETRLDPDDLAKREGVAKRTVMRWMHRGVDRCVLESYCVGKQRMTTEQAWLRFVEKRSARPPEPGTVTYPRAADVLHDLAEVSEAERPELVNT